MCGVSEPSVDTNAKPVLTDERRQLFMLLEL